MPINTWFRPPQGQVYQPLLPKQTTNPQNGKSHSKTYKRLAEILKTLKNASSDPNTITASMKEISELGVHNKPTSTRFFTKIGNHRGNNSQQYNLAYPTSSGIANHQLDLLNNIVTKLIEIKNNNEGLKPDVVDCLLNLSTCIDTHETLDKTRSNNNQQEVRDEIRRKIKGDEDVSKRYREIVLEAVKKNGSALQYASEELRGDRGTALTFAIYYGRNKDGILALIEAMPPEQLNHVTKAVHSALHLALEVDSEKEIIEALAKKCDVNLSLNDNNYTALTIAICNGHNKDGILALIEAMTPEQLKKHISHIKSITF